MPVNSGAIPDTLLESELFGHRKGAFTDAHRDRRGALAQAAGGTVFLDEIGDVSAAFQVKLLRFLQDGVVTPLGADAGERVDVRVLAATHRDLAALVAAGGFRQDLYFRLAAYEIRLPPLRERLADLPALVAHFQRRAERELGLAPTPAATAADARGARRARLARQRARARAGRAPRADRRPQPRRRRRGAAGAREERLRAADRARSRRLRRGRRAARESRGGRAAAPRRTSWRRPGATRARPPASSASSARP